MVSMPPVDYSLHRIHATDGALLVANHVHDKFSIVSYAVNAVMEHCSGMEGRQMVVVFPDDWGNVKSNPEITVGYYDADKAIVDLRKVSEEIATIVYRAIPT